MPIYKFKSFKEAEEALWHQNPDAAYYRRIVALWEFANKLNPINYPRGIFKFRTLEEANIQRRDIELEHARALREARGTRD